MENSLEGCTLRELMAKNIQLLDKKRRKVLHIAWK
jgi:hypothetical protein